MNPPTFPQRHRHLGGIQVRPTCISRKDTQPVSGEERSGSPLLTRTLTDKKKKTSRLDEKEISTNVLPNTTTETHTQDLRLFRCELSKVA